MLYIINLQVVNMSHRLLSESSEKGENTVLFVKSLRFYIMVFQHEAKWEIIISFGNNLQIQIAALLLREIQTTGKLHRACQDSVKIRPIILRLHLWWQWSQAKLHHLMVVGWAQILIILLVKAYRNSYKDKHIQIVPTSSKVVPCCFCFTVWAVVRYRTHNRKKWEFSCAVFYAIKFNITL